MLTSVRRDIQPKSIPAEAISGGNIDCVNMVKTNELWVPGCNGTSDGDISGSGFTFGNTERTGDANFGDVSTTYVDLFLNNKPTLEIRKCKSSDGYDIDTDSAGLFVTATSMPTQVSDNSLLKMMSRHDDHKYWYSIDTYNLKDNGVTVSVHNSVSIDHQATTGGLVKAYSPNDGIVGVEMGGSGYTNWRRENRPLSTLAGRFYSFNNASDEAETHFKLFGDVGSYLLDFSDDYIDLYTKTWYSGLDFHYAPSRYIGVSILNNTITTYLTNSSTRLGVKIDNGDIDVYGSAYFKLFNGKNKIEITNNYLTLTNSSNLEVFKLETTSGDNSKVTLDSGAIILDGLDGTLTGSTFKDSNNKFKLYNYNDNGVLDLSGGIFKNKITNSGLDIKVNEYTAIDLTSSYSSTDNRQSGGISVNSNIGTTVNKVDIKGYESSISGDPAINGSVVYADYFVGDMLGSLTGDINAKTLQNTCPQPNNDSYSIDIGCAYVRTGGDDILNSDPAIAGKDVSTMMATSKSEIKSDIATGSPLLSKRNGYIQLSRDSYKYKTDGTYVGKNGKITYFNMGSSNHGGKIDVYSYKEEEDTYNDEVSLTVSEAVSISVEAVSGNYTSEYSGFVRTYDGNGFLRTILSPMNASETKGVPYTNIGFDNDTGGLILISNIGESGLGFVGGKGHVITDNVIASSEIRVMPKTGVNSYVNGSFINTDGYHVSYGNGNKIASLHSSYNDEYGMLELGSGTNGTNVILNSHTTDNHSELGMKHPTATNQQVFFKAADWGTKLEMYDEDGFSNTSENNANKIEIEAKTTGSSIIIKDSNGNDAIKLYIQP